MACEKLSTECLAEGQKVEKELGGWGGERGGGSKMKRGDKRLILHNELVVRTLVWPVPMPDHNSLLYLFTKSYSCPFIVCCSVPFSVFMPSILRVGSRQRENMMH